MLSSFYGKGQPFVYKVVMLITVVSEFIFVTSKMGCEESSG